MTREHARSLRNNTTALEERAWSLLRSLRDEGIAVRRQHPTGKYVADFAVMRARLVIEIDGPLHEEPERQILDKDRDAALQRLGWQVSRFTPNQLDDELGFLAAVRAAATPTPRGEGAGGGVKHRSEATEARTFAQDSEGAESHPAPQPPPLAGRGSFERRTRANRKLPPRRKT